uniref:peptidoglycan-binding protein n=1 Tax=Methylobacterium sp. CCH5-D2 TaxID=1768765 RepID=UPI00082D7E4A|nr:peptidoglycan-binding protein [Methylobacterium sp. CCH5-D2]
MTDWKRILRAVAPNARADIIAAFAADDALLSDTLDSPLRIAHFLAQVVPESQSLTRLEENLSYSAERLCKVWPKRFPTLAAAKPFAKNPKALAERVYGGREGNVHPGDGWLFRGRGLGMLTFRNNYRAHGFEANPGALSQPRVALRTALSFWVANDCAAYADRDDVVGLRRVWNGGQIGIAETRATLAKAKAVLRTLPAQAKLKALRYPVGAVDGDHGDRTTGAVQLLQKRSGLPVTGELDDDTLAALDTAEPLTVPKKDADLSKSRTVQGAGVAGTFGFAELAQSAGELKDQAESAHAQISAGTVFGLVMGGLILAGAAYAIYARWDDAGRPLPSFLVRRFPRLTGVSA